MIKSALAIVALGSLLGIGCDSHDEVSPNIGNAALGIAEFRVHEDTDDLEVVGLDTDGEVVASLRLRVGHVEIDNPDESFAGDGRDLVIEVPGDGYHYTNLGRDALQFAAPPDRASLEAFVTDPFVSAALARWNIEFAPSDPVAIAAETDYSHGGMCSAGSGTWNNFCGGNTAVPNRCCQQHLDTTYSYTPQRVVCDNTKSMAERACVAAPICTSGQPYNTANPNAGCDTSGALSCPTGSEQFLASNGKYQCRIPNGTPCALKAVGPLGCAVCSGGTQNMYSGYKSARYDASTDTCSLETCSIGSWSSTMYGYGGALNNTHEYTYYAGGFYNASGDYLTIDLGCGSGSYDIWASDSLWPTTTWQLDPSYLSNNVLTFWLNPGDYSSEVRVHVTDTVTGLVQTFTAQFADECYFNQYAC